jgi:DNA-binding MarR family transcriptional regulator
LNRNQLLILEEVSRNSEKTISSLLREIEKKHKIPLSTLKLNAKILREIGLISFGNSSVARLTNVGKMILQIFENESAKNQSLIREDLKENLCKKF